MVATVMFAWLPLLWEWAKKLLGGFLPTSGEKIGKLIWVGVIAFLVIACFNFFQKPTPISNTYTGQTTVVQDDPKLKYSFFGCSMGHIRGGLQWKW